ncbi:MAG: trehalose-phosphatase [Caldilineaceae bacterium]
MRTRGGDWQTIEPLDDAWKESIRPILERFVERTPGSLIEEKHSLLAWHYRQVSDELAAVRQELKEILLQLTANLHLAVLEGDMVIEVKNVGISKGRAAGRWLGMKKWDFIMALGDDWTDEDTFAVLPESAYSIRGAFGLAGPLQPRILHRRTRPAAYPHRQRHGRRGGADRLLERELKLLTHQQKGRFHTKASF